MEIKSAKGIKGYLLYSPFPEKRYFFRIYKEDGNFVDYDIHCEELEIEILSDWHSLYESKDKNILDWSPKALGKDNEQ